jgi:hypothetical protein
LSGDCCDGNQYSNGTSCVLCKLGTDCSIVGTTLATQSLLKGYWRASNTSKDVRPCWVPAACTGSTTAGGVYDDTSTDCATTTIKTSNFSFTTSDIQANTIPIEDGVGCNGTSISSTSTNISYVEGATYCTEGYEGPCKCTNCHSDRTLLDDAYLVASMIAFTDKYTC